MQPKGSSGDSGDVSSMVPKHVAHRLTEMFPNKADLSDRDE